MSLKNKNEEETSLWFFCKVESQKDFDIETDKKVKTVCNYLSI